MFRPDGVGTVTQEEKEKFQEIKERLRVQLEYQLTNFRYTKRGHYQVYYRYTKRGHYQAYYMYTNGVHYPVFYK